jgi:hypothetical protein
MKFKLTWEEIKLVAEVARVIPDISPDLARAIRICYADRAPTTPVRAQFTTFINGVKRSSKHADRMALVGPESSESFGALSVGRADTTTLLTALRTYFGSKPLSDMAAALLERLEHNSGAMATEEKKGRGRPRIDFEEADGPKVTLAAEPKPAARESATIVVLPTRSPLPPELAAISYRVSEKELLTAYQLLRGVGL